MTTAIEPADELDALDGASESTEPSAIVLTEQQQHALQAILLWLEGPKPEFRLGGYAGTGKTTLIKRLMEEVNIATCVAAFTGKATSVLRRKGVHGASTLHSLMYDVRRVGKKITFVPKTFLPCDFVIVDEASMISTNLYNDLRAHRVKILFVGDPAQLEPVGDNPNLMAECDFVLTEIHRQARNNPILRLATAIRERKMTDLPVGQWSTEDGSLTIVESAYGVDIATFDIAICAKNVTRHGVNAKRRSQLGYDKPLVEGESTICLKNDRNSGVFNGMLLAVNDIVDEDSVTYTVDTADEAGDEYHDVQIYKEYFGKDFRRDDSSTPRRGKQPIPFDYGYCLTAHKSQGSEWDRVLVFEESLYNTDMARWMYTAATRAAKDLTIIKKR